MNSNKATQPIFIFSLPRSGSTLLQRILASSDKISTVAEPWIMLPLFGYQDNLMTWSVYSSKAYRYAIRDLIKMLPDGEQSLRLAANAYGMSIYDNLANGKPYFLDKTPRYHLIAQNLIETFPNAKYIFLWRNPLAVMASISRTWKKNRWTFGSFNIDLNRGMDELIDTYMRNSSISHSVKYEELTSNPKESLAQIESYLELPSESLAYDSLLTPSIKAKMGDPTGIKEYANQISTESIDRWQKAYNTNYRKKSASAYLERLGEDKLASIGYSVDELIGKVNQQKTTKLGIADYYYRMRDSVRVRTQSKLLKVMRREHPGLRLS